MANFIRAHKNTVKHEGGYVNDYNDRGGETYSGIARAFNPDWVGWSVLDRIANKKRFDVFPQLDKLVKEFYKANYWLENRLNDIKNQSVAELIYDWVVNSGKAEREVQKVLVSMGQNIAVDNAIGAKTIKAINSVDQTQLHSNIVAARVQYYKTGVEQGWLHPSFLNGLTARAESFTMGKSLAV